MHIAVHHLSHIPEGRRVGHVDALAVRCSASAIQIQLQTGSKQQQTTIKLNKPT